jgi:hypothetical protein
LINTIFFNLNGYCFSPRINTYYIFIHITDLNIREIHVYQESYFLRFFRGFMSGAIYKKLSHSLLVPGPLFRAEHFRFGPVLDQNKQPNRFFFLFMNRTEPKTGSNRLISVRFDSVCFPSKPVQTELQCQDVIL